MTAHDIYLQLRSLEINDNRTNQSVLDDAICIHFLMESGTLGGFK